MNTQYQPELDFTHTRDNNPVSQKILDLNRVKISSQVIKVIRLLAQGKTLLVRDAIIEHDISHLPRRIKDIEEKIDPDLKAERTYDKKGIVRYYFNEFQIIRAKEILRKIK